MPITYQSLSSTDSIDFSYGINDGIDIYSSEYWYGNGVSLTENSIVSDCKDFSVNNFNLTVLSKMSNPLKDSIQQNQEETIYDRIESVTMSPLHNITLGESNLSDVNFILEFLNESDVIVKNIGGEYLTVSGVLTGPLANPQIVFSSLIENDADNRQKFKYFAFGDDRISFFTSIVVWSQQRALKYFSNPNSPFQLDVTINNSNPLDAENIYRVLRLNSAIGEKISYGENFIVEYSKNGGDISILSAESIVDDSQYLVTIPYNNIDDSNTISDINIIPLKNFISPEGNSFGKGYREYEKIFTGGNRGNGFDNIVLSYNSNIKEYLFKSGKLTYFHYPIGNPNILISDTNLIKKGAIAADIPKYADKVFKKNAQYKKFTFWGEDETSTVKTGKYLCSWLYSPSNGNPPVWKDRYYFPNSNPSIDTSLFTSLHSPYTLDSDKTYSDVNVRIVDENSTITFEEGGLYAYQHVGKTLQQEFIEEFDANSLVKYLEETSNADITTSQSDTLGIINSKAFSVGFWMNRQDWSSVFGDVIFGNYHNGGFGIFINNKIFNPYCSIYDRTIGKIKDMNLYAKIERRNFDEYENNEILQIIRIDHDKNYFVLYSDYSIVEYNQNNLVKNLIDLSVVTGSLPTSGYMEIDSDKNIHFLKNYTNYYKIDLDGNILSSNIGGSKKLMWVNSSDVAQFNTWSIDGNVLKQCVDSEGNVMYFTDTLKLYKNSELKWNCGLGFIDIFCDDTDTIHLMYDYGHYAQLDNDLNVFDYIVIDNRERNFGDLKISISKYLINGKIFSEKYIFDNVLKKVYIYSNENLAEDIDQLSLQTFLATSEEETLPVFYITTELGEYIILNATSDVIETVVDYQDFGLNSEVTIVESGYDWQRRFSSILDGNISLRAYMRQDNLSDFAEHDIFVQHQIGNLNPGWHHFAVVFDHIHTNTLKLYIDSELKETVDLPVGYSIRNFENYPLFYIGKNVSVNDTMYSALGDTDDDWMFANLSIKDFKIYSKDLSERELFFAYNNANQRVNPDVYFSDIYWDVELNEGHRGFVEEIDKFYLHSVPGYKTNNFKISLNNFSEMSNSLKSSIQRGIDNISKDYIVADGSIYDVEWRNSINT